MISHTVQLRFIYLFILFPFFFARATLRFLASGFVRRASCRRGAGLASCSLISAPERNSGRQNELNLGNNDTVYSICIIHARVFVWQMGFTGESETKLMVKGVEEEQKEPQTHTRVGVNPTRLSIHLFIHSSCHLSVHPFIRPYIYPATH